MKTSRCPKCNGDVVLDGPLWKRAIGALLVLLSFLLFFPTVGVSFILGIYGVFMMIPRRRCTACQWHE